MENVMYLISNMRLEIKHLPLKKVAVEVEEEYIQVAVVTVVVVTLKVAPAVS